MVSSPSTPEQLPPAFQNWNAKDWIEIQSIWDGLLGDPPVFQANEVTPQNAGYVFERFIMEACRLSGLSGHYPYAVPMSHQARTREQVDECSLMVGKGSW
jgi:hypothetical protein